MVGSPMLSDNESLVKDKSINLNDVDVQLEGGADRQTDKGTLVDRHKSITLDISPNHNNQEMEFDQRIDENRKQSKDSKRGH